eukprot:13214851-Heterocapsa_arctica.AAC.1
MSAPPRRCRGVGSCSWCATSQAQTLSSLFIAHLLLGWDARLHHVLGRRRAPGRVARGSRCPR